jgi:serine O-acetyltransferase
MPRGALPEALRLIRQDAARWVRPEGIADPVDVTPLVIFRLAFRYLPLRATILLRIGWLAQAWGVRGAATFVQHRLLTRFGLDVAPAGDIGGGLYIAHPVGCVLHADQVGENVSIIGGVTFGTRGGTGWPTIGDRVFLGAGSQVLGGVHVGDDAQVGANAVVIHDVAPGTTVVGAPARPTTRSATGAAASS